TTGQTAIPLKVVILAVDRAGDFESGFHTAARVDCAAVGDVKGYRFGNVAHGEVALQFVSVAFLYKLTLEFDFGEFFGVEEVVRLEVIVTTFVFGVNGSDLCCKLNIGIVEVVRFADNLGIEISELTFYF